MACTVPDLTWRHSEVFSQEFYENVPLHAILRRYSPPEAPYGGAWRAYGYVTVVYHRYTHAKN